MTKISHHLQLLSLSNFKYYLYLFDNQLTGTLHNNVSNMHGLGKLLCTHCIHSIKDLTLCMIICI